MVRGTRIYICGERYVDLKWFAEKYGINRRGQWVYKTLNIVFQKAKDGINYEETWEALIKDGS